MTKAERKVYNRQYRLKHREHILFYMRKYNLKYYNRRRKYYQETKYQANMPVDLFMMRNRQKFNEGISLNYE